MKQTLFFAFHLRHCGYVPVIVNGLLSWGCLLFAVSVYQYSVACISSDVLPLCTLVGSRSSLSGFLKAEQTVQLYIRMCSYY